MPDDIEEIVLRVIARAPRWIRVDLLKNGMERQAAEESLAALIVTALKAPDASA